MQEPKVPLEPILAFPLLNLPFHPGCVRGEFEGLAIAEPDVVVGLALEELDSFGLQGCIEVVECLSEEIWEEEKRRALIKALGNRIESAHVRGPI